MLFIHVETGESVEKAIKRFKKKFEKTGVLKKLRRGSYFEKRSVTRRNEILRASYRQSVKAKEMN